MAWERRKGRMYYYRSRRVNGQVVREYVGTGEVAEIAAKLDALAAVERVNARAATRASIEEIDELERVMAPVHELVDAVVHFVLTHVGYHMSRGKWRKKRKRSNREGSNVTTSSSPQSKTAIATTSPTEAAESPPTLKELIRRARSGDAIAMRPLYRLLDDPRAVDDFGGNVFALAMGFLISKMVGPDLLSREAMRRKLDLLRASLVGENATELEGLVADRVVSTWLHLYHLEGEYAHADDRDLKTALYHQQALTLAQSRYFAAINELVLIRGRARLVEQINVAHEEANVLEAPEG